MNNTTSPATSTLAASITKAASKQTYYTIRLLVDRGLVDDAYRAYAYFRWVDDRIDLSTGSKSERIAFVQRQISLLEECYRSETPHDTSIEEQMLVELIQHDQEKNSGLQLYLRNMMKVMAFDVDRYGRLITQDELSKYTHNLASAVTEAMHYFIGNACPSPQDETRYLAVIAAHITHMLRDTIEDVQVGYVNIPMEYLRANHIEPHNVQSEAFREWVKSRVQLARQLFKTGKANTDQVKNLRCRLAGYAYTERFEWLLDTIEKEQYYLRPEYNDRKRLSAGLRMGWRALLSMVNLHGDGVGSHSASTQHHPIREL
jgi:phytoene/squalene synthetase